MFLTSIRFTEWVRPATRPSAPLARPLAVLLLLAGEGPAACRALPANAPGAHSGAFNCGF